MGSINSGQGLGFPKEARLLKRRQFLALSDRSVKPDLKIRAGSFLIIGRENSLERTRLGVTVTKKIGGAVVRNRLKRQVREFFRHNVGRWSPGLDLLFIARGEAAGRTRAELRADLARAGEKIAGLKKPAREAATRPPAPPETVQTVVQDFGPGPDLPPIMEFYNHVRALPGRLALGLIRFYQRLISPLLPPACRFWPTCSSYAAQAITVHGLVKGGYLTARRLLKCHPFHPGGYDPVPPRGAWR